jgi:hypothetical protein
MIYLKFREAFIEPSREATPPPPPPPPPPLPAPSPLRINQEINQNSHEVPKSPPSPPPIHERRPGTPEE